MFLDVDMTNVKAFRTEVILEVENKAKVCLTSTDIIVKTAAKALENHPFLNPLLINDQNYLSKTAMSE